jgi:hypothetical protein
LETVGILFTLAGLVAATYGAYALYRADYPRNEWILKALYSAAERPTYGVIAPTGWSPVAEKESALAEARKFVEENERFIKQSRHGMRAIWSGFILQAIGNVVLLCAPHFQRWAS